MHVALISFWFAEYCVLQANALAERARVTLLFPTEILGEQRSRLSPRVEHVDIPHHGRWSLSYLVAIPRLARLIRRLNPDVIHTHSAGHSRLMLAMPLLRRFPLLLTVHDPTFHSGEEASRLSAWAHRLGRRRADHFTLHSEALCQTFHEVWGIDRERMTPLAHGLLDYSHRHDPDLAPPARGHALLFGRLQAYKGIPVLIEAAARLRSAPPEFKIVIAGRGDDMTANRARIAELGLEDRIIFLEQFIDEPLVDALHRHARVIVLPYLEASQSGPATTACAYGKPLIASRVGALPDVVRDGETGLLVPPGDPDALAEALDRIATDDALTARLSEGSRRFGEEHLSWEVLAPQHLEACERAIAARRRALGH
jgi:glycosyltransferase involved in cell wall biosynthesis